MKNRANHLQFLVLQRTGAFGTVLNRSANPVLEPVSPAGDHGQDDPIKVVIIAQSVSKSVGQFGRRNVAVINAFLQDLKQNKMDSLQCFVIQLVTREPRDS